MVNLRVISLAALGIAAVLTVIPVRAEACKPSDLRGRVKSVIETEFMVDPITGKIGEGRLADRVDVSQDGAVFEMAIYAPGSADPALKSTTHFESGRPVRGFHTAKGKTVPSLTCSYDAQGRLVASRTGSNYTEFLITDTYEYGSGFVRRRTVGIGGPSVTTETLDADGRVVKEVVLDEATATVHRTSEFTYDGNRTETCVSSQRDPRRQCVTTVKDSHGNEIEAVEEGRTKKTSYEYDAAGNWVWRRFVSIGSWWPSLEIIVQRKIEYW